MLRIHSSYYREATEENTHAIVTEAYTLSLGHEAGPTTHRSHTQFSSHRPSTFSLVVVLLCVALNQHVFINILSTIVN